MTGSPMTGRDPLAEAEALLASGKAADAVDLLKALIAANRGGLLARVSLGRTLLAAGELAAALDVLREAAILAPGVAPVATALGEALLAAGHLPAAIGELQRALRLDPDSAAPRYLLGCCWLEAGEPGKALDVFSQLAPDGAPHLAEKIAQSRAMHAAARAAPGYVRHLFDQFAGDYDARMLGPLSYRAPAILRELADLVLGIAQCKFDILDLGCGTGLSGAAFAGMAARLDGVDLSPLMLEQARTRGIYGELICADLETALAGEGRAYDLILAADTLVYLGDLASVFAGAARHLKPGGFFLFTVERKDGAGFDLGPKRRWRHAESYLREQAASVGLDVAGLIVCTPRNEAKEPVGGFAVALQRRE